MLADVVHISAEMRLAARSMPYPLAGIIGNKETHVESGVAGQACFPCQGVVWGRCGESNRWAG